MSESNRIDRVADELAIRNLLAELAWQADSTSMDDVERYVDCFTPDAVWEVPGDVRSGHDDIRAGVTERRSAAAQRQGTATAHILATTTVTFEDDDSARVRSYVQAVRVVAGEPPMIAVVNRYDDRFRRTSVGWKLHRRRIEFL
jgi:uncharacterized protein (TIGR02246 family)